jgi:hypothetical protein
MAFPHFNKMGSPHSSKMASYPPADRAGIHLHWNVLVLMACLLLLACAPTPTPAPTLPPSETPAPSPTSLPSPTASATATLTSTPTLTLVPTLTLTATQTLTATPAAAFDKFQIISVSSGIGGISVIIKLEGVTTAYQVKIRSYDYACVIDAKYPDRLFCSGLATPPFDKPLDVVFIDPQSHQVVYSGSTIYSSALFATPLPVLNGKNDCPTRGQGVSCEVECRLLPDNTPCIVATCTDSCGLYRSIETCPQDMSKDFASCTPDLFARMKARYNLP